MAQFTHFETVGSADFWDRPLSGQVEEFVNSLLDVANQSSPSWISVPQLPLVDDSRRNKINKALAVATGKWRAASGFTGKLILPLIVTHQRQTNLKTSRNPKVSAAIDCYSRAAADGIWVVDKSLDDESGSPTLRDNRFPGLIALHQELNQGISPVIRCAGPYWGLSLLLQARQLIDYPAIGVGSGYQYFLAGGHATTPSAKVAIVPLRRRVAYGSELRAWLDQSIPLTAAGSSERDALQSLRHNFATFSSQTRARRQIASFYKDWCNAIEAMPQPQGRYLFLDLANAYAFGKSLPEILGEEGGARRPEAIANSLMTSCL
ncbi:MAG: hypothetical protein SFV23_21915 [Planctomycetaceae bacterium]|nr:hypothetical protein [Planctomycetaceae bacterium]